jgi:hypothetical protein
VTFFLLKFAITIAVTAYGYWQARKFVQTRLRYVDAVHGASAPLIAGVGAALVGIVAAALLPLVTVTTAIVFGAGVAVGVNAGARDIRRRIGAGGAVSG